MSQFRLEKWYLDVNDASPAAFIGYAATLSYRGVQIPYAGYTSFDGRNIVKKNSFRRHASPEFSNGKIIWKTPLASGMWGSLEPPVSRILLEDKHRVIAWECLIPKARATVSVDGSMISGFGYAEKITLTFMPWTLPIKELHWGRFLSADFSVIWIKWVGENPKDLVFLNGKEVGNPKIEKSRLVFDGFSLLLTDGITLREGSVGSTVFKNVPAISKLFPSSILMLEENKWLSNGNLVAGNSLVAIGHAIHEVVVWK